MQQLPAKNPKTFTEELARILRVLNYYENNTIGQAIAKKLQVPENTKATGSVGKTEQAKSLKLLLQRLALAVRADATLLKPAKDGDRDAWKDLLQAVQTSITLVNKGLFTRDSRIGGFLSQVEGRLILIANEADVNTLVTVEDGTVTVKVDDVNTALEKWGCPDQFDSVKNAILEPMQVQVTRQAFDQANGVITVEYKAAEV